MSVSYRQSKIKLVEVPDGAGVDLIVQCSVFLSEKDIKDCMVDSSLTRAQAIKTLALGSYHTGSLHNPKIDHIEKYVKEERRYV